MNVSDSTIEKRTLTTWTWIVPSDITVANISQHPSKKRFDPLQPLRQLLDRLDVKDPELAHRLCQMIPAQCPFERDFKLFGRIIFHIPPLCKLNPFYEQVANLRFRALCYLADECGEDVTRYC